ncbi:MAG: DUF4097 family beta strand repeat-containing protein [Candidatus Limiplasma sp.]|nr:DUF4097 family beta strand repeat-containing protein [Candidatus Limiplasma sp.]
MERNESFVSESLNDIVVHMAWAQVEIFADEIERVQVLAAGDEGSVGDLRIETENDTLLVEQPQYGLSLNIMESRWMQVCIRVPKSWTKKIHVFTIGGLLNARGLNGSRIVLDTVSGDMRAMRMTAREISLKSISGDVRSDRLTAGSLTVRTVSGNITLDEAVSQTYKCTTVSGDVKLKLKESFESMDVRSVSGDVTVLSPVSSMNVSMRSISGRVATNGVTLAEAGDNPAVRMTGVSADLKLVCAKE